jgi:hypothetical protein
MQELMILGLTLILAWFILRVGKRNKKKSFSRTLHKQSDTHRLMKLFFSMPLSNNQQNFSQLTKHKEKGMIKVMVLGNEAYWISNNIFYVAEAINGEVQRHTTKPIDTSTLSKGDLDKMLFILDSLKDGKRDDRGSSGHK